MGLWKRLKKKWLVYPLGLAIGLLGGLFGAGGGMIAVPMLRAMGVQGNKSHATSLAITLPLAVASGFLYFQAGHFHFADAWIYLPGGVAGALLGGYLLPRIKTVWLRRAFGVIILFSAGRLLWK